MHRIPLLILELKALKLTFSLIQSTLKCWIELESSYIHDLDLVSLYNITCSAIEHNLVLTVIMKHDEGIGINSTGLKNSLICTVYDCIPLVQNVSISTIPMIHHCPYISIKYTPFPWFILHLVFPPKFEFWQEADVT